MAGARIAEIERDLDDAGLRLAQQPASLGHLQLDEIIRWRRTGRLLEDAGKMKGAKPRLGCQALEIESLIEPRLHHPHDQLQLEGRQRPAPGRHRAIPLAVLPHEMDGERLRNAMHDHFAGPGRARQLFQDHPHQPGNRLVPRPRNIRQPKPIRTVGAKNLGYSLLVDRQPEIEMHDAKRLAFTRLPPHLIRRLTLRQIKIPRRDLHRHPLPANVALLDASGAGDDPDQQGFGDGGYEEIGFQRLVGEQMDGNGAPYRALAPSEKAGVDALAQGFGGGFFGHGIE